MELIIGTLLDVTSAQREYDGRSWIEHTAHMLDGVATVPVTLQGPSRDGSNPGLDPVLVKTHNGERVALEVYSRGGNNKRVYKTATRLVSADDLADALGLATV
jgi:hypothetical protein